MIKTRVLTALAVPTVTCIVAAPAGAAQIRECGNIREVNGHEVPGSPGGIINLTTRNVACGYARHVSVQVTEHWGGPMDPRRARRRFVYLENVLRRC